MNAWRYLLRSSGWPIQITPIAQHSGKQHWSGIINMQIVIDDPGSKDGLAQNDTTYLAYVHDDPDLLRRLIVHEEIHHAGEEHVDESYDIIYQKADICMYQSDEFRLILTSGTGGHPFARQPSRHIGVARNRLTQTVKPGGDAAHPLRAGN